MSEPQPNEQTVYVADNVDEFVERTRLTQILESRQTAGDMLRDAQLRRVDARQSGIPEWQAREAAAEPARAAVESYILDVERLYHGTPEGRKLWDEAQLGVIDLVDALSLGSRQGLGEVVNIRLEGRPIEDTVLPVQGVSGYLSLAGNSAEITYEKQLPRRGSPVEKVTETVQVVVPVDLSKEAFKATNALLVSSDLGVKLGPAESDDVGGEYADLLDGMGSDSDGD